MAFVSFASRHASLNMAFVIDVKPSNILIGFDGVIKLCDFGISKVMDHHTTASTYVGCLPYFPVGIARPFLFRRGQGRGVHLRFCCP